ncbi:MAG: hypothetical protein DLM60_07090 [Pseudonocardiales bacterium]|nr:MAG: hypothetical protein DLM60_07090 [Pseudonocardiales bacterium]
MFWSGKVDLAATRRFFTSALKHGLHPGEVSTDRAPAYSQVLDELLPAACHVIEQYANSSIEADHVPVELQAPNQNPIAAPAKHCRGTLSPGSAGKSAGTAGSRPVPRQLAAHAT